VVDGVFGVVVVVFTLLEDSGSSIELELDLGGQSTLEVDDPQRLFFANGDSFNLRRPRDAQFKLRPTTIQHN
jgi:hypothetical protein